MRRIASGALALTAALAAAPVFAQDYPVKPIRWIIPYPPGGATDISARIVAPKMGEALGQQLIIENRGGGAAIPAMDFTAKASADGYTIMLANIAFGANPSLFKKLPFDPAKDFVHISKVAIVPMVLAVHPSLPVKSAKELVALARAKPGAINYGSAGNGSANHLATEVFKSMAKVDVTHILYKGGGPAVADLVAGQIQMMFATILSCHQFVQQGKLRALAISNSRRTPALPDVPTVSESGVAGYEVNEWQVLVAPAGTPPRAVDRLHQALVKALADPTAKERLAGLGAEADGSSPQAASEFVRSELARWARIAKEAGIKTVD